MGSFFEESLSHSRPTGDPGDAIGKKLPDGP